jgi:hypothetical protein
MDTPGTLFTAFMSDRCRMALSISVVYNAGWARRKLVKHSPKKRERAFFFMFQLIFNNSYNGYLHKKRNTFLTNYFPYLNLSADCASVGYVP